LLPPLVKLGTSAAPGEAKYVCLVGAGLSKDAGLPTAWDLMLSTAALIRAGEDADPREDLQTWFLSSPYKSMTYSELIGGLFSTSVEQQNFIREKLRANEPGKAHLLVAELARLKVLRCVITTNFDDLIEKALGKVGLSVQVISNDDDLEHSEPLIHCKSFRVYKPHGSIGVGRLRNTPADLQELSALMENELVSVLRDHGLIVLGYSGNDEGIHRVFRRRKQRFYPTFWVNPSEPPESIPLLFQADASGFTYVPCAGAAAFLQSLLGIYRKLAALAPASGLPASVVSTNDSIRNRRPEATASVRSFTAELLEELKAIAPDYSAGGEADDLLVEALEKTKALCCEFATMASAIAETNSLEAAKALYQSFGGLLSEYWPNPDRGQRHTWNYEFDFFKFIGHELFAGFFASLIKEDRWELIPTLLAEGIFVKNSSRFEREILGFDDVSDNIVLLDQRNQRLKLGGRALHRNVLRERHIEGALAKAMPHEEFVEADFFLSMTAYSLAKGERLKYWRPWSVVGLISQIPSFLVRAKSRTVAERLLMPLGVNNLEEMRQLVIDHRAYLTQFNEARGSWSPPYINPDTIGSL
jgi:hypothetical protein